MSGHSKWSTIKRKKGAADAKRGQIFTKLGKAISIAAREGGGDPETNFTLRLIMDKAKQSNMPMDNIERAIKRGTGEIEGGGSYERGVYGGYGPGGVPLVVDVLTDNKNRTVSEIRSIFSDHGGSVADAGSVLWQFHDKGLIVVKSAKLKKSAQFGKEDEVEPVNLDEVLFTIMDIEGVEDVQDGGTDDESGIQLCEVITLPKDLAQIKKSIEEIGYIISSAEMIRVPERTQSVAESERGQLESLIEALEEQDDVENVWTTAERTQAI